MIGKGPGFGMFGADARRGPLTGGRRPLAVGTIAALIVSFVTLTLSVIPAQAATASVVDINPDVSTSGDPDATTGGRVSHLGAVPGNNQVFYAASEQGGIFKTTNTGANWTHLNKHQPQMTWDVKVDPGATGRVYATSFYDGRVNSLAGIEVSTDAGANWTHPATAICPSGIARTEPAAFGIGIRPDATQNVYIGTNCGVARSSDSGATWSFVNTAATTVWSVLVQSGGPTGQGVVNICGNNGFQRSTDAGGTWTSGAGLPTGVCSLAASPDESYVLFATASDSKIYESDNGGTNWNSLGTPEPSPQGRIPFVKTNKRTGSSFDLWFGDIGLWRGACTTPSPAAQGGARRCPAGFAAAQPGPPYPANPTGWAGTFSRPVGGHDDLGDIVFDTQAASDACPRVFSSDGGAHVNSNTATPGCHTPAWNRANVGLHALWGWGMTAVRAGGGLRLFLGVQDDGFQSTTNADAATPTWANPQCCDVFSAATDSNRVVITQCCFGGATILQIGNAAGTTFSGAPNIPPGAGISKPQGHPDLDGIVGFRSTSNLVNFGDKRYGLVTANGFFVTNDITTNPITWTQLGSATSPAGACGVQVAISGATPTFFLQASQCASSSGGSLWRFTGTGAGSWNQIDNTGGQSGGIGIFGVNPTDPNRLYASNLAAGGPRMVFSNDSGLTWNADTALDRMMTGNGVFTYANQTGPTNFSGFGGYPQPTLVAFDPNDPNLLVAGGHDSGVFFSADRGNSWGLMTDPFNGTAHLPQPRFAFFDHPSGPFQSLYIGTQGRGVWRLTPKATTLTYTGAVTGDFNDAVTLSARLMDASTNPATPIVGALVTFTLGSQTCSGTTDATGQASCALVLNQNPGAYQVTATFAGDGTRMGSTTTKTFTITKEETALTYNGDTSADYHDQATLSAVIVDPDGGAPIAGLPVDFQLGTQTCSGTSAPSGQASCTLILNQQSGPYTVIASFAGSTLYKPSTTSASFTIKREETTLTYTGATLIANGQPNQMSAVLKEDGTVPIAGRMVTFTLGTGVTAQTCVGTTDAAGVARCTIVPAQPLGPGTVRADFAGDVFYLPSSDSATTLVFAFLDSGSMVVGDRSATVGSSVTFWGAKWARDNSLSGGLPPRAFKGFAATTSEPPVCGTGWSSGPGNSAGPPASVPSYMGTIVSTNVDQAGSTISGDSFEIVVIKTDPGYAPNPGHAGTGTVLAVFCHS